MPEIDLERERKRLDRLITYFHFSRARAQAVRCLRLAAEQQSMFFYYYFKAQGYILRERFRQAIACLDKAIGIRPDDGCAYNDQALCFAELAQYRRALEWFNLGIRHEPDCASLYHNKGWLLNLLGRHREATICFIKALELEPNRPEAFYSLADSCVQLRQYTKALTYYKRALCLVKGKSSLARRDIEKRLKTLKKLGIS